MAGPHSLRQNNVGIVILQCDA